MSGLRGDLRINEPMKNHTSWRAGGNVDRYYIPADLLDLASFLHGLPEREAVNFVGLGSNLLIRDGGLRGAVVAQHAQLNDLRLINRDAQGGLVFAGAGVACAKVARFAARHDLAGAEFLAGIPGTIGGALAMNAGCFGVEIWDIVTEVQTINRQGKLRQRQLEDYCVGYRQVELKYRPEFLSNEEWFTGGWFTLKHGNQTHSLQRIKNLLMKRIDTQPLNLPNAGSVFRNPFGDYAARLIESCDMKGLQIGGAAISSKHANFIVNMGGATATDIESLINIVQETVKQRTGIELITEVRIIGDARSDSC